MSILYSILIQFYGFVLQLASIFNKKAEKWRENRVNWRENLTKKISQNEVYCWLHCASAGEFEQAIPLINKIKSQESRAKTKIAVSFFSASGFEMYEKSDLADLFFYFPLDTKNNAKELIEILKPKFVIFVRNEIWWNTLYELDKNKIPTYLVNANLLQKRSFFYKYYLDKTYPLFTKIFDSKTFGNTKLERVCEIRNEVFKNEIVKDFCKDSFVIILGSSWQTEEKYITVFYKKYKEKFPNLKIIIAPHEFNETKRNELEKLVDASITSYTNFTDQSTNTNILFLDKKGILKYVYRYANIAIIGGGYDKTIHNVSEAAVYGIPTLFGPNYSKFEEIIEMVNLQIAFSVLDYSTFENELLSLINNNDRRRIIKEKCVLYFSKQKDVAAKIVDIIIP